MLLGYAKWDNFSKVIDKAKIATENTEIKVADHFAGVGKMVDIGSGSQREIEDIALTRYACYLIAQNGYASKPEIAFAQTYFAVQTRKQEIIELLLLDIAWISAYVLETKGIHLIDNEDTLYKKKVFALCSELGTRKAWKEIFEEFPNKEFEFQVVNEDEWKNDINNLVT